MFRSPESATSSNRPLLMVNLVGGTFPFGWGTRVRKSTYIPCRIFSLCLSSTLVACGTKGMDPNDLTTSFSGANHYPSLLSWQPLPPPPPPVFLVPPDPGAASFFDTVFLFLVHIRASKNQLSCHDLPRKWFKHEMNVASSDLSRMSMCFALCLLCHVTQTKHASGSIF